MGRRQPRIADEFPGTIYVWTDSEGTLLADRWPDGIDDGATVAVYERKEIKRKRVEHTLVGGKKR
jgi:hypothetical protein